MTSVSDSHSSGAGMAASSFAELTKAVTQPGQPHSTFQAFDKICAEEFGHRLFTILAWQTGSEELERVYTSRPVEYPTSARKRMGPTAWGSHVLRGGHPWFGETMDDIRWAFPDHQLIESLGCASCLNVPVRWNGTVLGAVNVLDAEGAYRRADLERLDAMSSFLIGPLLISTSIQNRE